MRGALKACLVEILLQIFGDRTSKAFVDFGFLQVFFEVFLRDSSASF
jgi:hypothetical protein